MSRGLIWLATVIAGSAVGVAAAVVLSNAVL
jgi:hypothetical protein